MVASLVSRSRFLTSTLEPSNYRAFHTLTSQAVAQTEPQDLSMSQWGQMIREPEQRIADKYTKSVSCCPRTFLWKMRRWSPVSITRPYFQFNLSSTLGTRWMKHLVRILVMPGVLGCAAWIECDLLHVFPFRCFFFGETPTFSILVVLMTLLSIELMRWIGGCQRPVRRFELFSPMVCLFTLWLD